MALALAALVAQAGAAGSSSPATTTTDETQCNSETPAVVTLRQSADDEANAAVVAPNCSVTVLSAVTSNDSSVVDAANRNIAAVTSFPQVTHLYGGLAMEKMKMEGEARFSPPFVCVDWCREQHPGEQQGVGADGGRRQ